LKKINISLSVKLLEENLKLLPKYHWVTTGGQGKRDVCLIHLQLGARPRPTYPAEVVNLCVQSFGDQEAKL
jgi:hypothetical protein